MRKLSGTMIFAIIIVLVVFFGYFNGNLVNSITENKQSQDIRIKEEVQFGLQCAPQMAAEFGGLYRDRKMQNKVKAIGQKLVSSTDAANSINKFDFHVLADSSTVNAFAIPGGQIFITIGLLKRLKTDDEIAGILAHEIGHIIGRHAEDVSQENDTSEDIASYVTKLISLNYNTDDELESDNFEIKFLIQAGYKPEAFVKVRKVLAEDAKFKHTHPSSDNYMEILKSAIEKYGKK